jgi:hypothetical protein
MGADGLLANLDLFDPNSIARGQSGPLLHAAEVSTTHEWASAARAGKCPEVQTILLNPAWRRVSPNGRDDGTLRHHGDSHMVAQAPPLVGGRQPSCFGVGGIGMSWPFRRKSNRSSLDIHGNGVKPISSSAAFI